MLDQETRKKLEAAEIFKGQKYGKSGINRAQSAYGSLKDSPSFWMKKKTLMGWSSFSLALNPFWALPPTELWFLCRIMTSTGSRLLLSKPPQKIDSLTEQLQVKGLYSMVSEEIEKLINQTTDRFIPVLNIDPNAKLADQIVF